MALIATVAALLAGHHHDGCDTRACERRVDRKEHRKTVRAWRRATRPYRGWLASVRWCESRGDYSTNTGNGYYGAYQFDLPTWWSVGGYGMPHLAEAPNQDYRAVVLRMRRGTTPWPMCG
jgi:resuscitation-promoting factor RpfA